MRVVLYDFFFITASGDAKKKGVQVPKKHVFLVLIYHEIKGPFNLRSGWRGNSLSGLLTVKGTVMREQGSLKGEGTHRGNLCVDAQIFPNPDSPVGGAVHIQRKTDKNVT